MPLLPPPKYRPPFPFTSGHLQTIFPTLFRPMPKTDPEPVRIETPDSDFIDLDIHKCKIGESSNLAVVSHGLEGGSRRKHQLGMARHLTENGWDVICYNFRGCSGEPNRLPRLYHSGVTDDLHTVLTYGLGRKSYERAALIGFSMGGNQTLKYLGENPELVPEQVCAAVVFSVPCQLADCVKLMSRWGNRIYIKYFLATLKEKVRIKAEHFPGLIDLAGIDEITTFVPFDDRYTAPIHGFRDAADYYRKCSARQFLGPIKVPTLLVQAQDDPFLSRTSYPVDEAEENDCLYLEIPEFGGHAGFMGRWFDSCYWSEQRALSFIDKYNA